MNNKKYQIYVNDLWQRASTPLEDELRLIAGVSGEWGEVCEKIKKGYRDGIDDIDTWRSSVKKEFGDLLFYIAQYMNYLDIDLDEAMEENILKLYDRRDRDKLGGSGDDR